MLKLYQFSNRSIEIISLLFTGILAICGFVCTCYALDMETQLVLTKWDSPLWNLLGIALFLSYKHLTDGLHYVIHLIRIIISIVG